MAFERLAAYDVTLNTVVTEFIQRRNARETSISFKELFGRFINSRNNRSAAYLLSLKYTLPRFHQLHERLVTDLQPNDIESELAGMTSAVRNAFLRNLRAVFNYGVKRGWLDQNPISKLDFETIKRGEVVTLSPKQAAALLKTVELNRDLLPYHVLGLFAGIRPLELQRLNWRDIDLDEGRIEITAEVSKTGRRRIINIEPNLKAWLNHYITAGGGIVGNLVPLVNLRTRVRLIRSAAGLTDWTQDVMRHSYASYWLAQHGDINQLTLQMGHENPDMLWKHYHKASKKKDAALYWAIMPAPIGDGERKIVSIEAA
jgi:Site-specific recombinase XerC